MPEGDTVWRTAHHLDQALSGQVLTETDFRVPALATVDLAGRTVDETVSRGKHLLTRIGDRTLHTHLKMEGSWHLYKPGTAWRRPAHEARVVLRTEGWAAVGFALGVVELVDRDAEDTVVGHLGPDLLGPDWDEDEALRRLLAAPDPAGGRRDPRPAQPRRRRQPLQERAVLPGRGAPAAAGRCGAGPAAAGAPGPARALEANKHRVEQTLTGDTRRGKQTWVYRRERQPCRRCGTRIVMDMTGPESQERATYWCPSCQPDPRPDVSGDGTPDPAPDGPRRTP